MSGRTRTPSRPGGRSRGARSQAARPARRPVVVVIGAVVAVGVAALAWMVGQGGGSDDRDGGADEVGVAHVHGLGVDPADGTLYVATHHGVFRLPERGGAVRVGDIQDTMGFTVVGESHFLGSGHPGVEGMEGGQPPLLGLIESTDGAATWDDVSLSGEVDFHALGYAHDQVYGWDATSSRFMVSTDKREWETRSTVQLLGFAVDPDDAEHILATTPEGVQSSGDGGRTWQPATGAPPLVLVAWDSASGVWGVDRGGVVHHGNSTVDGWEQAGTLPGPPQALLASDAVLYAAVDEDGVTGIYRSADGGATWELRYRDGA